MSSNYTGKHYKKPKGPDMLKKNIGVIFLAVFVAIAAIVYFAMNPNDTSEVTTTTDVVVSTTMSEDTTTEIPTTTTTEPVTTTTEAPTTTTTEFVTPTTYPEVVVNYQFDVLSYGADQTGTMDNRVAFQAAIDAAYAAGGGTVYVPAGIYKFETYTVVGDKMVALQIRNGVSILGESPYSTMLVTMDAAAILVAGFNVNNVSLFNLDIDTYDPDGVRAPGVWFDGVSFLTIYKVNVHTSTGVG